MVGRDKHEAPLGNLVHTLLTKIFTRISRELRHNSRRTAVSEAGTVRGVCGSELAFFENSYAARTGTRREVS